MAVGAGQTSLGIKGAHPNLCCQSMTLHDAGFPCMYGFAQLGFDDVQLPMAS